MTFLGFFTKAVLDLTAETIQLFTQRRQKTVQTLAILLINPTITVFKNTVGKVFKLLTEALFAVDHLANFIVSVLLCGFHPRGHFTQIGLQRGVNTLQAAHFVIEQFTLCAPVLALGNLLFCRA